MSVTDFARTSAVAFAIVSTGTWGSPVHADIQPTLWFAGGTTSGTQALAATADSPAARIARLRQAWSLTWSEFAALFGVSRRAAHTWAAGGQLRARNVDRLEQIERALETADSDPAANRRRLFGGSPAAPSLYARLVAEVLPETPHRATDLLGAAVDAPLVRGRPAGSEWQLPVG